MSSLCEYRHEGSHVDDLGVFVIENQDGIRLGLPHCVGSQHRTNDALSKQDFPIFCLHDGY